MFDIQEELKKLPAKPGVYLMHNSKDEIIYVGKAIKLCNRVRQYFQDSRNLSVKIQHMVKNVAYFEYIITEGVSSAASDVYKRQASSQIQYQTKR